MNKEEIIRLIKSYWEQERLGDIYFVVDEQSVRDVNGWLHVEVRPSRLPRRISHLYNLLADINAEIMEKENLKIVLTSGEPLFEKEEAVPAQADSAFTPTV